MPNIMGFFTQPRDSHAKICSWLGVASIRQQLSFSLVEKRRASPK
jgi:hypothetical protein